MMALVSIRNPSRHDRIIDVVNQTLKFDRHALNKVDADRIPVNIQIVWISG
jgi:hypothetical protein